MKIRPVIVIVLLSISVGLILAQTSPKIQDFSLINAVDNNNVSLSSYKGKKAIVVIFTSNYCPYSKLYEKRIQQLVKEYSNNNVQFLLINPNTSSGASEESVAEMNKRISALGMNVPYLVDKDQSVTQLFGATKTPEVFVLSSTGAQYSIIYAGSIDDNPQVEADVSRHYLKEAIEASLTGKAPSVKTTRATGCTVKKPVAQM